MAAEKVTIHEAAYIQDRLQSFGLKEFTRPEILTYYRDLTQAIEIGVNRVGQPTFEDGGVYAINTGISPITPHDWNRVPTGSKVLAASFGGTNWISGIVEKDTEGRAQTHIVRQTVIPSNERKRPFLGHIELMADELAHAAREASISDVHAVGISFGFGHSNQKTNSGVDAQFMTRHSARGWERTDFDETIPSNSQPFIGRALQQALQQRGLPNLNRTYFLNDTNSVVNNVTNTAGPYLPVGFVFGTGTNAAYDTFNLETSTAQILPSDPLLEHMRAQGLIKFPYNFMAFWMGGDYIRNRVVAASQLLSQAGDVRQEFTRALQDVLEQDKEAVSKLAIGAISIAGTPIENFTARKSAQLSLSQAGQLMGVTMASTAKIAGYENGQAKLPIEGSVYWNGSTVADKAQESLSLCIPNHQLVPTLASGLAGIGQFTLAKLAE